MRTRRLKSRIIAAFALLGLLISSLFGISTIYVRKSVEDSLITSQLQRDVDAMVDQIREDPNKKPGTSILQAWMYSEKTLHKVPLEWQALSTGVHDMQEILPSGEVGHYKLAVRHDQGLIGYVRYNVDRDELTSQQIEIAVFILVVAFSALSFFVGVWSSSRVISPVLDLAKRLRAVRSDQIREPLAPHFSEDEVGELAAALDHYNDRLRGLIDRDRDFNADVSHELRTPLAIISSTAELMLSSAGNSTKQEERLLRIRRAVVQGSQLIEALLLLSRNERAKPGDDNLTDVSKVVDEVIESCRSIIQRKRVTLHVVERSNVSLAAPQAVLAVVLSNLIGNACKYTTEGSVEVRVLSNEIIIEDTGVGLGHEASALFERGFRGKNATGVGGGLGLSIVKRICELYEWQVTLSPRSGIGSVATLKFSEETQGNATAMNSFS